MKDAEGRGKGLLIPCVTHTKKGGTVSMTRFMYVLMFLFIPAVVLGAAGDILQSFPAPASCPTGLAYDGSTFWVADRKADLIYQIEARQGTILKFFPSPGFFPTGLAWDGSALWVSDMDFENTSTGMHTGKIYRIDPATGMTTAMIESPTADPQGLAWDGQFLWVADPVQDRLYKISPEDGTTIIELPAPASDPQGLAWDGRYLWVSDRIRDELYRVHPETGCVVMILRSPGSYPRGLAWKDNTLWNADYQSDEIYQIKVFDTDKFTLSDERYALIEYTHQVMNGGPGFLKELQISIAEPRSRDSQKIVEVAWDSKPVREIKDQWGQKIAQFQFMNVQANQSATVVMSVKAKIYDIMYHIVPENCGTLADIPQEARKYLADGSKLWIQDPLIRETAQKIARETDNPYWIARNIFDFLREKMHYELAGGWNVAPTVLKRGSGSCSEYSFVYIAICRAAGLPARYAGSVVVRGDDASLDDVFHRWVEVFLPNYGWIPVDPSGGDQVWPRDQAMYFGHLAARFLITTEGGGGSEYLGWDYNSAEQWKGQGPVRLRIEKIAEWDPLYSK